MAADDSYRSPVSKRLVPRALGGVLAVVVTATGVADAVVTANAGAAAPTRLLPAPTAHADVARRTTPVPATVWVSADVATVWIKPSRARRVDGLALRTHPRIGQWIGRQTLRQRNDLDTRVMTQALHGDALVQVRRRADGWSEVRLPDQRGSGFPSGIVGWVPSRQLTTTAPRHRTLSPSLHRRGNGLAALRLARAYMGTRYLWGGMSSLGIDCSGLTYRVYRRLGVTLPRDAADQSRVGRHVARKALRVGDLVFFGSRSWRHVHHVGIYAGHGWLLHAPHTGTVVQLTRLRAFPDYWGARRIVQGRRAS
jgi:cell wall-associated NlpC family hydrolase